MPQFWLEAFSVESWDESRRDGFRVVGFRKRRYPTLQRFHQGDVILCWIKEIQVLVGALRVIGEPYLADLPPMWSDGLYSARIAVEPLLTLPVEQGCDLVELLPALSFYDPQNMHQTWAHFRGSPNALQESDGHTLLSALADCYRRFR